MAGGRNSTWIRSGVSAFAAFTAFSDPASAQLNAQPTSAVTQTFAFDIRAKPLLAALTDFTAKTHIQIVRPSSEFVRGQSSTVSGDLTAAAALARLLAGTGLTYRFTSAGTVKIENAGGEPSNFTASVPGATQLDTINVDGQNGTPDSQTYVAKQALSATKTSTPLIEVPQAISVVTRKELDQRATRSVGESIAYTAGVLGDYWGGVDERYDKILIRGFDSPQYLDGLQLLQGNYAGLGRPEPYGLERIEVLKGPASVLFGQNPPGGLVNLVSKRPTQEPIHEIDIGFGSNSRKQLSFDLGGPVDKQGTLTYRLTALGRESGTQIAYGKDNRVFVAPAFTYAPTGATSFTFLSSYLRESLGNQQNVLPPVGTLWPASFGRISTNFSAGDPSYDHFYRTSANIGYQFEHRFDDIWTIRQNVRYNIQDAEFSYVSYGGTAVTGTTLARKKSFVDQHLISFSADNQVESKFATGSIKHDVLGGLDFRYLDTSYVFGTGTAASINLLSPIYGVTSGLPITTQNSTQTGTQVGPYLQDQMRLDKFVFTVSGRYDAAAADTTNNLTKKTVYQDDHAGTWRAGINYVSDIGLAPYVAYSTSFLPTSGTDYAGNPFKPTIGQQYEAGLKYQPVGTDTMLTFAAYNLTQQNVTTSDPVNVGFNVQTGEVRVRGFEAEAVTNVTADLSLRASYTFMDGKVLRDNDYAGKRPAQVPRNIANLWAIYTIPTGPAQGVSVGGGVRYQDSRYGDSANQVLLPSTVLFDATLKYDLGAIRPNWKGITLSVNANNLFDKVYVSQCPSTSYCQYGVRRTVYGQLQYRW